MNESIGSDRWTFCRLGHIHWGAHGGAGLLLRHVPQRGHPVYLLAERSRWVDEGGTWGIPGGAIHDGESPEAAARREASEEIWPVSAYHVTGVDVQDCGGGWKYWIVCADVDAPFAAYVARETDATGWFTLGEMPMLRLHPGFRKWVEEHTPPAG
jgi:8-oxo-dGTP pyrophosphatase MutT (NUDIX family)